MPQDPELALLNRKLEAESLTSGVVLMRVTPGAAVAAVAAPAPAPMPAEGAATEGAATDGTAAAAVPISTLQAIPVVVEVVGPFADVSTYLQGIQERLGRDFLIESLNVVAEKPAAADGCQARRHQRRRDHDHHGQGVRPSRRRSHDVPDRRRHRWCRHDGQLSQVGDPS